MFENNGSKNQQSGTNNTYQLLDYNETKQPTRIGIIPATFFLGLLFLVGYITMFNTNAKKLADRFVLYHLGASADTDVGVPAKKVIPSATPDLNFLPDTANIKQ